MNNLIILKKSVCSKSRPLFKLFTYFLLFFCAVLQSCSEDPFDADSGTFTDKRDGNVYQWVKIGEQIWMAENLAYIPYVCAPDSQCGIWVYDYYGEGSFGTNYQTYGCLYNWEIAQEVCPEGWHLPSDEEWMEMESFLGMPEDQLDRSGIIRGQEANVGGKLKEPGLAHWKEPNEGATNESGLSVLPGGYLNGNHAFSSLNSVSYFWTTSLNGHGDGICRMFHYDGNYVTRKGMEKNIALSIRCIKN
nr:fibrobacter succinogenes major paralogous domain-containing protein [uncultured Draconibacterium sp.]